MNAHPLQSLSDDQLLAQLAAILRDSRCVEADLVAHIAAVDERRLYLREEAGKGPIALIEASAQGYRESARFEQPERSDKNSWPHPVVAGGRLYIRDQDVLLCYDVRAK